MRVQFLAIAQLSTSTREAERSTKARQRSQTAFARTKEKEKKSSMNEQKKNFIIGSVCINNCEAIHNVERGVRSQYTVLHAESELVTDFLFITF